MMWWESEGEKILAILFSYYKEITYKTLLPSHSVFKQIQRPNPQQHSSWFTYAPRNLTTDVLTHPSAVSWAVCAELSDLPRPAGWIHTYHPPSTCLHQQRQNNLTLVKISLCLFLSNICALWSHDDCFCAASSLALICQINAFLRESFLLLPRWWADIIKLFYLTILITGFMWWLHFCHRKDSEDFSWCTAFPRRGGM